MPPIPENEKFRLALLCRQIQELGFPPETGIDRHWREEAEADADFAARLNQYDCRLLWALRIDPHAEDRR